MTALFTPATRRAVKLKVAMAGPSGSGKTLGALALAQGLAKGGKIAVIDTENGSASLYADRYGFDALALRPPYLTAKYREGIKAAVDGGYAVVVIDSISHQWDGTGGILQRKEETDHRGGNHFSNWKPFTDEHNEFRALLLEAPIHVVATMRSKMSYAQQTEGNKTTIKKIGLQPIQRDGMEYEFTIAFDVQMDHKALASKDRTGLFTDLVNLLDPAIAARLLRWLDTADQSPAPIAPTEPDADKATGEVLDPASDAQVKLVFEEAARAGVTKEEFPTWYQTVTGRPWVKLYEQDVAGLTAAALKRRAERRAKAAPAPSPAG